MADDLRGKWNPEKKCFEGGFLNKDGTIKIKNELLSIAPDSPVMVEYKKVIDREEEAIKHRRMLQEIKELRTIIKKNKLAITKPIKYLICVGENEHVRIGERLFLDEIDLEYFYIKIGKMRYKFLIHHDAIDKNIFAPFFEPVFYETK